MRALPMVMMLVAGCKFSGAKLVDQPDASDGTDAVIAVDGAVTRDASEVFLVDHIGAVPLAKLGANLDVGSDMFNTTAPPADPNITIVAQTGGGEVVMITADRLRIRADLRIIGSRPLVLVANTIEIEQDIDGSARPGRAGPGAATDVIRFGSKGLAANFSSGGGGGGHGTAGAEGGLANGNGAAGGQALQADFQRLVGGAPGGDSAECAQPSAGGGGGGAIQLSATVKITVKGRINVGGGGGTGGSGNCGGGQSDSGAGGGSGGMIYLQAPNIELQANAGLFANGGGGGGGGGGGVTPGGNGVNGGVNLIAASGGGGGSDDRGGGNGGFLTTPPTKGNATNTNTRNGGGGGGAVGSIGIRGTLTSANAAISPPYAAITAPP